MSTPTDLRLIKRLSAEPDQANSTAAQHLHDIGHAVQQLSRPPRVQDYRSGKTHLHVQAKRGATFHACASLDDRYLCCNVQVLAAVSNCPYECSYCFLQNYLTDPTLSVVGDTAALLQEIREKSARQPWRFYRIGTWELGDSLALEPLVGTAAELVTAFSKQPNALLELRTKSAHVDTLLNLPHGGRTVVSWTLNPAPVIRCEEYRTASLGERLEAMAKAADAGYLIAVHFDPMIYYPDWETGYEDLVRDVFRAVPAERMTWISMGSLRFNPEMKKVMEDHYPGSRATHAEMVLGDDGKVRYIKPLRLAMYHKLYEALWRHGDPLIFVYLCMERWDVWQRIFGRSPQSIGHLDYLMTRSLYQRFPGLVHQEPDRALYDPS